MLCFFGKEDQGKPTQKGGIDHFGRYLNGLEKEIFFSSTGAPI